MRIEEALNHFHAGLALSDEGNWDGALAEFLRSREIFPGHGNTVNAAKCLRRLKRYDEALEMFETYLALPDLKASEKEPAEKEAATLLNLIGTIEVKDAEPGATILIDSRSRGTAPATKPFRVNVGTHVVRVYKDGFEAFETRVEVAGRQPKTVLARLAPLSQAGRLKVIEHAGRSLDVVLDNVVVGKTPWEGPLAAGDHVVFLRDGETGTQPAAASVRINQMTSLTLQAEPLTAALRVEPTPAGAAVALDGVSLGNGLWEGRLRAGAHKIEVRSEGFVPQVRDLSLVPDKRELLVVTLDRDPTSSIWRDTRGRFFAELNADFALAPVLGGDLADGCKSPCASSLGLGFLALGRGGYRFSSGFMLSVDAGYLLIRQSLDSRATVVRPQGLPANPGVADDALTLQGALVGASAGIRLGSSFPLTFRLGAGVLLGSLTDRRTGDFTTVARPEKPETPYSVDVRESLSVTTLSLSPEARIGMRLGERFELSLGAQALVLIAFSPPAWLPSDGAVLAATDGEGRFASETLMSKVVVVVVPGLGARYEF
ncbi:MAG: PEGA domain-containing protein [Polyangiaceae bacterium]